MGTSKKPNQKRQRVMSVDPEDIKASSIEVLNNSTIASRIAEGVEISALHDEYYPLCFGKGNTIFDKLTAEIGLGAPKVSLAFKEAAASTTADSPDTAPHLTTNLKPFA
jgi:hypothetical protein